MRLFSDRLILRTWQEPDKARFAEMSADPAVMQYVRPLPTRQSRDAWVDFQIEHQSSHGFCMWAVELRASGAFIGSAGLLAGGSTSQFTPGIEVGWRLAHDFWGHGFATEAGNRALEFGFRELRLPEIVAHASVHNARSRRVMSKLGMSHNDADDFDHPRHGESDPLRRQALYRVTPNNWLVSAEQPAG